MAENNIKTRDLTADEGFKLGNFLKSWEMVLVYILIIINVVLSVARPDLYSLGTLQSIIQSGMDVSPLVLGMVLVLMLGDIDVSCAAVMIFSAMCTGLAMDHGAPAFIAVLLGLLGGVCCGAVNGWLVAYIGMPAVIVTISSSMLFRGIVEIILNVNSLKNFPEFYVSVSWNNIANFFPLSLLIFLIMGAVFVYLLQKSRFGRTLYIIGNNATCGQYSGIDVKKTKLIVFMIMGLMSGIASIFFVGRMGGSVSSSMGTGYEMNAIATCVLGGVSTNGGKGKVYGPIIATLIMAFLTYTLGLMNIDANNRKIVTGIVLIIAILISNFRDSSDAKKKSLASAKAAAEAK